MQRLGFISDVLVGYTNSISGYFPSGSKPIPRVLIHFLNTPSDILGSETWELVVLLSPYTEFDATGKAVVAEKAEKRWEVTGGASPEACVTAMLKKLTDFFGAEASAKDCEHVMAKGMYNILTQYDQLKPGTVMPAVNLEDLWPRNDPPSMGTDGEPNIPVAVQGVPREGSDVWPPVKSKDELEQEIKRKEKPMSLSEIAEMPAKSNGAGIPLPMTAVVAELRQRVAQLEGSVNGKPAVLRGPPPAPPAPKTEVETEVEALSSLWPVPDAAAPSKASIRTLVRAVAKMPHELSDIGHGVVGVQQPPPPRPAVTTDGGHLSTEIKQLTERLAALEAQKAQPKQTVKARIKVPSDPKLFTKVPKKAPTARAR